MTVRKNKLLKDIDHELWTKTTKRARKLQNLKITELIEKLLQEYNEKLDLLENGTSKSSYSYIVLGTPNNEENYEPLATFSTNEKAKMFADWLSKNTVYQKQKIVVFIHDAPPELWTLTSVAMNDDGSIVYVKQEPGNLLAEPDIQTSDNQLHIKYIFNIRKRDVIEAAKIAQEKFKQISLNHNE